jgi:hypothetical protein
VRLDPIHKIWLVEPLIELNPTLRPELLQFILEASELQCSEKDEFNFWWKAVNLIKDYNLRSSNLYPILTKMILKNTTDDYYWDGNSKIAAFVILLDSIPDSSNIIPQIIEVIGNCSRNFYSLAFDTLMTNDRKIENKAIVDSLWRRNEKGKIKYGSDLLKLNEKRLEVGLISLDEFIEWFYDFEPDDQLENLQWGIKDPKIEVAILVEALKKGIEHQFLAVNRLREIGPAAIQSVPSLKQAKEATKETKLKIKIEEAIFIIENR